MTSGPNRWAADIFDHKGRLRIIPEDRWSIYVAFAKDGAVKVGVTHRPVVRVFEVHTQQRPIKAYLWTWVDTKADAYAIESCLKRQFKARHIEGEWFRFDYAKPDDKSEFHRETKRIFQMVAQRELAWTRGDMQQMLTYVELQKEIARDSRRKGHVKPKTWR